MLPMPDPARSQRLAADDQPVSPGHSRRSLLRAGVLGGSAAAMAAGIGTLTSLTSATPAAAAPSAAPPPLQNLFAVSDLDFETLFAFGSIGYGCAEFGELVTVVNQINTAGASYQTYYESFWALAQRTSALADAELAAGRTASARSAYLRASTYYAMCLYFILGTTAAAKEASAYAACQRCFQAASQLFDPPFEPVRIPYGNTWLPGYLLRPDTRPVRRPFSSSSTDRPGRPALVALRPRCGWRTPSSAVTTRCSSTALARVSCCSSVRFRSGPTGRTSSPRSWTTCGPGPMSTRTALC